MDTLSQVREKLLSEAQSSPAMLSDIAGLERYISESYANRAFIELLQNADDAGATHVTFTQKKNWILVANSGRAFSESDFQSICRSASSQKRRGESIGYRGIGFKSVVGISKQVHLISGDLSATFDRELTQAALGLEDSPVPLVRIPHPLNLSDDDVVDDIRELKRAGYSTFFVLSGIDAVQAENEFEKFDAGHLIFLRNVEEVRCNFSRDETYTCRRILSAPGVVELTTQSPYGREEWRILSRENIAIAVATEAGGAVPLERRESLVHSFLPTQDETGIPARINGDFSTDPSRTRVVLDTATDLELEKTAALISDLVIEAAQRNTEADIVSCLTPYVDDITLQFERSSFRVALASKVRSHLENLRQHFLLAPEWLNQEDSRVLEPIIGKSLIPRQLEEPSAMEKLAFFCGLETVSTESVFEAAILGNLSTRGFAELVAKVGGSVIPLNVGFKDLCALPCWPTTAGVATLEQAAANSNPLENSFLEIVEASGLSLSSLQICASRVNSSLGKHIPTPPSDQAERGDSTPSATNYGLAARRVEDPFAIMDVSNHASPVSLPKWRSAEKAVHEFLEKYLGFRVEDRSRQFTGYDLWAQIGTDEYFIEVKSISYPGDPFSLTPNEDSFARDHGDRYVLCLVLRTDTEVRIQFIRNPRASLQFERQCRKWVLECNEYYFEAQHTIPN